MPSRVIVPALGHLSELRTQLTLGEKRAVRLLHEKLPHGWEIYIQPHLNGCRPDIVLLNPEVGIGVLEIKDWRLEQSEYRWTTESTGRRRLLGKHDGRSFSAADPTLQLLHYKKEIFDLYCPRLEANQGLATIGAGL